MPVVHWDVKVGVLQVKAHYTAQLLFWTKWNMSFNDVIWKWGSV